VRILKGLAQGASVSADYKGFRNNGFRASTEVHILKDLVIERADRGAQKKRQLAAADANLPRNDHKLDG
jgi:hypothetical protein